MRRDALRDAHKQHAEITCLKFVTPLVKKSAAKGPRCVRQRQRYTHTETNTYRDTDTDAAIPCAWCPTWFALDFINRKTSTQVSVSLAQRAGGDEADEDPPTIPGVEK